MPRLDMDRIINGTPEKELLNAYDKMKSDYNEESAKEYFGVYKDAPTEFILQNSKYIFTEPYFGLDFYRNLVTNSSKCIFTQLYNESTKISAFITGHADMPPAQKDLLLKLQSDVNNFRAHTKNTVICANYIKDKIDDNFEKELSAAISNHNTEKVNDLFEDASPLTIITYYPYIANDMLVNTRHIDEKLADLLDVDDDVEIDDFKKLIKLTLFAKKLISDSEYNEKLNSCNKVFSDAVRYIANISIENVVKDIVSVVVKENDVLFSTYEGAINDMLSSMYEDVLLESVNNTENKLDNFKSYVLECSLELLTEEWQTAESTEDILVENYPFIEEGTTLESAILQYSNELNEINPSLFIEEEDDVSDDDIDSLNNDIENDDVKATDTSSQSVRQPNQVVPKAPKAKNRAIATQNKFMSKEAKFFKKKALKEQKRAENRNAIKAVTAIPKNVADDIKKQVKTLDEKDDARRKEYMTEPGFRKKAFRNLKLAILYGSVSSTSLALLPITMICRHFSKQKDVRIRNELVRELETDIRVTEEKISDAQARGDDKQKYKLMRIRDQLNAEMVRVRLNSKYV